MKTNFIICKMFLRIVLTAIFFIFCHILHAQVSGIVTDRKNHRPMAGVTILIKNTEFGVATEKVERGCLNAERKVLRME